MADESWAKRPGQSDDLPPRGQDVGPCRRTQWAGRGGAGSLGIGLATVLRPGVAMCRDELWERGGVGGGGFGGI